MASRYVEVARTYARWPLLLIAAALTAYLCMLYGLGLSRKAERLMLLAGLMWITAGAAGTIAAHVKQQFIDASAALMPGYRTPHLLIGASAMLIVSVVIPTLAAPRLGFSAAAVVGMALVVAASTAWFIQLQDLTTGIVCNVLWLSLLSRRVVFAVGAMLEGRNDVLAGVLIATGMAGLVALWARLARMHEGMREYGRRPLAVTLLGPVAVVRTPDRWFDSMLCRPIHTRCIAAANGWARVRHLRATGLGRLPWLMGALMAVSMLAVPWLTGGTGGPNNPAAGALESFIVMSMILPVVSTIGHWGRRWPALGYESLRPASRQRFVRELGLVIGLDLAEAWAVVTAAALIPVMVWDPSAAVGLITSGFLLIAAATALVAFGLNWWVLRLRSTPLTAAMLVLTGLAPVAPMLAKPLYTGTGWAAPMALGLLALGAVVTFDAYARWCRADLE